MKDAKLTIERFVYKAPNYSGGVSVTQLLNLDGDGLKAQKRLAQGNALG